MLSCAELVKEGFLCASGPGRSRVSLAFVPYFCQSKPEMSLALPALAPACSLQSQLALLKESEAPSGAAFDSGPVSESVPEAVCELEGLLHIPFAAAIMRLM